MGKTESQADGGLYITAQTRSAFILLPCINCRYLKHLLISFTDWLVRELWELCWWCMKACFPKIWKHLPFSRCWTWAMLLLKMWRLLKYSELGAFGVHGILISALPIKAIPVHLSPLVHHCTHWSVIRQRGCAFPLGHLPSSLYCCWFLSACFHLVTSCASTSALPDHSDPVQWLGKIECKPPWCWVEGLTFMGFIYF